AAAGPLGEELQELRKIAVVGAQRVDRGVLVQPEMFEKGVCLVSHYLALVGPASLNARGAPPPRALARRLRASLGAQALQIPQPALFSAIAARPTLIDSNRRAPPARGRPAPACALP